MATSFKIGLPGVPADLSRSGLRRHDLAYAYLKALLLDGGLEPGEQLSSDLVGRAMGISRAPVADALRRLALDGLIEVVPQVGCRVVSPVPAEVADFYRLFAAAEAVIAGFSAERRTAEQAVALRQLLVELSSRQGLPAEPDARAAELRRRNRVRYERLHELAGSPLSAAIGAMFWDRSDFFLRVAFGRFDTPRYVTTAYRALFDAVVEGDAETAARQAHDYLARLGGDVAAALARQVPASGEDAVASAQRPVARQAR